MWAVRSKAYRGSEESNFAKYVREVKESALPLAAGFSIWLSALHGVTTQPKHATVISGVIIWCIFSVVSDIYWYGKYPDVFKRSQ